MMTCYLKGKLEAMNKFVPKINYAAYKFEKYSYSYILKYNKNSLNDYIPQNSLIMYMPNLCVFCREHL
jgi:hypothetical protein